MMRKAAKAQTGSELAAVRSALLAWYARHKRDLPWRRDRDPYRVWVSEVMLQQTRVAAVQEHYRSFLDAFPTLEALACAPEWQVLSLWSGLGYYRRARMLHRAARQLWHESGGEIPRESAKLHELPGVGRYTAAAIASIAFAEPVAVVDGNVERILLRFDGAARNPASQPASAAWKRAQQLLDPQQPGDWNQAMMELGAAVCTPQNPQCDRCCLRQWCRAPGLDVAKPRQLRRRVQSAHALIERGGRVYLVQRPATAAKMAGMWELPECGRKPGKDSAVAAAEVVATLRHSITDSDFQVQVVRMHLKQLRDGIGSSSASGSVAKGRWVSGAQAFTLPLTGLARKILRSQGYGPGS